MAGTRPALDSGSLTVWPRVLAGLLMLSAAHATSASSARRQGGGPFEPATRPPSCEAAWRWASPVPQGFDLTSVTHADRLSSFIAVGRGGAVTASSDGKNWSHVEIGLADDINGIAFGNDLLVAVGSRERTHSPLFLASRDGVTWESRDTADHALVDGAVTTVVWDGGRFLALDENGAVWESRDGESWPALSTPIVGVPWFRPNQLTWTGAEYLAVGYGKVTTPGATGGVVLTSHDASTWDVAFFAAGSRFNRIAFSPFAVVVVGDHGIVASRAGAVWTSAQLQADLTATVWTGERFLAVGSSESPPSQPVAYESPDGADWTLTDLPELSRTHAFAAGDDGFVAVGEHGACAWSSDGRAWQRIDRALAAPWQSVAWVGDSFLAVGDHGAMATSPDGASWLEQEPPTDEHLHDIVWTPAAMLAVGNSGTALLSSDGKTWESAQTGTVIPLMSAVWDGSRFVVAGGDWANGYTVLASHDGVQWQQLSDEATPPIRKLEWTGRSFIGIGGGEIHSSSDAVNWTPVPIESAPCYGQLATSPTAATSDGRRTVVITHDALCDVAGNCSSVPLVSSDGVNWQCGDRIPLAFAVAFNGAEFVAVGEEGTISTSVDGVTWATERGRGSMSATLSGIASSRTTTVTVGVEGTVLYKSCPRPRVPRRRLRRP